MFLGAAQFFVFLTVAETMYPDYSVTGNTLSDLGATCNNSSCFVPPSAGVFNTTVFALGALVFVGSFFLYISRFRLLGGLAALGAWGVMGVALFPETAGSIHSLLSLVAFLFGGLAAIVSYTMLTKPFSYFAVALGAVSLVALALYVPGVYLGLGVGGMERLVVFPELIWVIGFGAYLMARPTERAPLPIPL